MIILLSLPAESISEGITTTIASSNIPLTTFEAYDVENSTVENVTLEFVDLSTTTEAISSTASVMQYLETASYKQGMYIIMFCYLDQSDASNYLERENIKSAKS